MDVSVDRIRKSRCGKESAWRAAVHRQVCHLLLMAGSLHGAIAAAAFPAGIQGPEDISSLRTPWYYIYGDPQGAACKDSEQEAIDVILNAYRSWPSTCEIIDQGVSGWPSDPDTGSRLAVGYCTNEAKRDFGPLPDASDQNAKPHYLQQTSMSWTRIFSSSSSCPNDLGQTDESRSLFRYSYNYCPDGYAFYYSQEAGAPAFCRRGNKPERDQETLCGTGGGQGSSLAAGNPIFIGTGKKYQQETDYIDASDPALVLIRHYDSRIANYPGNSGIGMFGAGWSSTYERRVGNIDAGDSATRVVRRPNGHRYYFNLVEGSWVSNSNRRESLLQTTAGWLYTTTEDVVEYYDVTGRLLSLTYPNGREHRLAYDGQGRLAQVLTTTGESLSLAYTTGRHRELVEFVTDHTGRSWQYIYSPDDTLEFVVYPDGTPGTDVDNPVRQYHYENTNFPFALTGITDERGIRYASYGYDSKGRAVYSYHGSAEDAIGRVDVDYNDTDDYSDSQVLRTVTNSKGDSTVYTTVLQHGVARLAGVSGPGCTSCGTADTRYNYDPIDGFLLSRIENGVITEFGNHDANGNPGFMIEAKGTPEERRTDYSYDPRYFRKILSITQPSVFPGASKVSTYGYDNFGNRTSETIEGFTPQGISVSRTRSWQYNGPLHQLSLVDGPRTDVNDTTVYRYYPDDPAEGSNRARLKEIENATGILTRSNIQYTATGQVLSESRPNGLQLFYRYYPGSDRLETLTRSGPSGIQQMHWRNLATGEIESISIAEGTPDAVTVTFDYDDARRLVRVGDARGNHIDYLLDSEGNRSGEEIYDNAGVLVKTLTRAFDAYNHMDTYSQENEWVDTDYASDGFLHQKTDAQGSITAYSYDALKRLLGHTRDLGGLNANTEFDYDVADQLTSVIDPVDGKTTYVYDDLGNRLEVASPDTGTTRYHFDEAGNLITRIDAREQLFSYTYDSLNRLTFLDAPGTEDDIAYGYDNCTNGVGYLCSITLDTNTVVNSYDVFGNITASQSIGYDYDAANRIRMITYPSGSTVRYLYDATGQVSRIDLAGNDVQTILAEDVRYVPFGDIESLHYGNGVTLSQTVDTAYRLAGQLVTAALDLRYTRYDANGNLLTRVDGTFGSNDYSYDALDRLTAATGGFGIREYQYDLNGNRLSMDDGSVTTYGYVPQSNRLVTESGWQYTLDANGNTASRLDVEGGGRLYTYNSQNRLVTAIDRSTMPARGKNKPPRIADTLLSAYTYNGLGQRVSKDINGSVSRFVYNTDGKLMAEIDETGVVMREYVYLNKQLLAVLDYAVVQGPVGKEVIVDNGNPPAGWVGKSSNKDYGEGYLYSTGGSGSRVRWTPVLEAGEYEVYVWYVRNPKNSNSVQYTVMHDSQSDAVPVDQTVGGGAWQLLGRYSFNGTGNEYIEVSDSSGGSSADAVRFVKVVGDASAVKTTVSYVHNDHLGTPRVMTDESGRVVWRALYDPFGNATVDPLSTRSLNARFPGQYFDSETGLHYNYYRYYDPVTGRYLTSDPRGILLEFNDPKRQIAATMGVSIPASKGAGYLNNSYDYVGNNPANRADPTGEIDPITAGVIIWSLLYLTHAGDAVSETNGNVWGESDRQDGICTLGPILGPIGDSCFPGRCERHDDCFAEHKCTASSWVSSVLGGTKSCNQCNSGFFK